MLFVVVPENAFKDKLNVLEASRMRITLIYERNVHESSGTMHIIIDEANCGIY